jgi:SRSO17 transposase
MDRAALDRVSASFAEFHAYFAPLFGRKETRQRGEQYMRGLLTQAQERRNAENLAEIVDVQPRVLQRFLSEAPWKHTPVISRLQAYLGPALSHAEAVLAVDESGFPKQGTKSVGVSPQYCGALGKVANCQIGVFLAYISPRGRALVDERLWLPEEWTKDPARCKAAGVPEEECVYRSKWELALEELRAAKKGGFLTVEWVVADDAYGESPGFRDGVAAEGWHYVAEVPSTTPVWPEDATWITPPYSGSGRQPKARPVIAERQQVRERAAALPAQAWQPVTVGEGAQGPRTYLFACERVRESREGEPGSVLWLVHRKNLDGREPRYYFSNAPADTPLETLARVAAARWPIETEFETEKSDVGLDEYEVRSWQGWHHHITLCMLASAFLLHLQQEWGEKDAPGHPPTGLPRCSRALAIQALHPGRAAAVAAGHSGAQ